MIKKFPLDQIDPNPWQPRQSDDPAHIEQLAISIGHDGLMQTPSGRQVDGRVQLAFGHSRLAAFKLLAKDRAILGSADGEYDAMPVNVVDLTDEQMFQQAVAENVKRRDLNPIEMAAAMQRYQDDFHKTSKEIAELFDISDSTVRGTIRLLDLPEKSRTALARGQITVGTGRLLLSAAKVVSDKTIGSIMTDISKGDELPDVVIQNYLDRERGNIVQMWAKYNGGKPLGGHNGWPLDMKNFPNEMLAPLTEEETKALDAEKIEHLTNPPACSACPYYIKVNGNHYCGMRVCFNRKQDAYKAQKLAHLSRTLKIEIYQMGDGSYIPLDEDHASHKKAFENRIPDLRLIDDDSYKGGWIYQNFPGLNRDIAKVVVVGPSMEKLVIKGSSHSLGGKKTEVEKAEARAIKLYRKRRKELMWEYTAVAEHIFVGVPEDVLTVLTGWKFVGVDDRIPDACDFPKDGSDDEKMEWRRRNLVWHMIVELSSFWCRERLVDQLRKFGEKTTVPAVEELVGIAHKWDDEIIALAVVSTETEAS
jgi:ParB/RepB/Spo0J family partition protein